MQLVLILLPLSGMAMMLAVINWSFPAEDGPYCIVRLHVERTDTVSFEKQHGYVDALARQVDQRIKALSLPVAKMIALKGGKQVDLALEGTCPDAIETVAFLKAQSTFASAFPIKAYPMGEFAEVHCDFKSWRCSKRVLGRDGRLLSTEERHVTTWTGRCQSIQQPLQACNALRMFGMRLVWWMKRR